jgi:hypothetical protein
VLFVCFAQYAATGAGRYTHAPVSVRSKAFERLRGMSLFCSVVVVLFFFVCLFCPIHVYASVPIRCKLFERLPGMYLSCSCVIFILVLCSLGASFAFDAASERLLGIPLDLIHVNNTRLRQS